VSGGSGTVSAADVTNVAVACTAAPPVTSVSDNFDRSDGSLGANWANIADGGLAISGDAAAGTAASGVSGDIWAAGTFSGDQFSQIELTSTQLTGAQWIGAAVRAQPGGQQAYVGIYFWNNGSPAFAAVQAQRRCLEPARLVQQRRARAGNTAGGHCDWVSHLSAGERLGEDNGDGISASRADRRASSPSAPARPTTGPAGRPVPAAAAALPPRRPSLSAGRCRGCRGRRCWRTTAATA